MAKAQYYDLSPRKMDPDSNAPEGSTAVSKVAQGGCSVNPKPTRDKENTKPAQDDCHVKAEEKRQQVLDQTAASHADERSRLCIFQGPKAVASDCDNAGDKDDKAREESAQSLLGDQKERSTPMLTVPHGPSLSTALRSSSRSASRSRGSLGKEGHSLGHQETSRRSRGISRERHAPWTPELSVRSIVREASHDPGFSVRSQVSSTPTPSSVRGRCYSSASLTFPKAPELATEARSHRSRSAGTRTPSVCTPERSFRTASFRAPSLTFPKAPELATEARSHRSRSAGTRTPSVCTPERSFRSASFRAASASSSQRSTSGRLTRPIGPNLATELRSRSRCHSTGTRTPSAHSATSRREWSTGSRSVTIPVGPHLETELRSRGRSTSKSRQGHCPGTPDTFHSCSSARGCSVRSSSRGLTVPVGPLLRTEMRSWSRDVYSDRLYSKCTSSAEVLVPVAPSCRHASDSINAAMVSAERARSASKVRDSKTPELPDTHTSTEECDATKAVEAERSEATDSQANVDDSSVEGVNAADVSPAAAATTALEKVQSEATAPKVEASPEAVEGEQSETTGLQANLDGSSLEGIDATKAAAVEAQSETTVPKAEAAPQDGEGEQSEASDPNAHVDHISLHAVDAANAACAIEKVQPETTAPKEEAGPNYVAEIQTVVEELQNYTCPQNSSDSVMVSTDLVCEAKLPSKAAGSSSPQCIVHRQEASGVAHLKEVDGVTSAAMTPGKLSPTLRAACKKEEVLAKVAQDQESKKKKLFVFGKSPMTSSTNQVKK